MTHVSDEDKIAGARSIEPILQANSEPWPLPAMVDAGHAYGWRREAGDDHQRALDGARMFVESWYSGLGPVVDHRQRTHVGDNEKIALANVVTEVVGQHERVDLYATLFDCGCRFGQVVQETGSIYLAFQHIGLNLAQWYGVENPWGPGPVQPGQVRKIQGQVRAHGRSFADDTGPIILHGCSDFAALPKFHQDRDAVLRDLDVMAQHVQYVRVLWRLNGWHWSGGPRPSNQGGGHYENANLTVDPKRDGWYDETLRAYLQACHDRGLRVNLSTGDMNDWSRGEMEDGFRRTAQIAASVSPDLVWLGAAANELRGTMRGTEDGHASSENLRTCEHLMRVWEQHYPWGMRAITDDGGAKAEMKRAAGGNATCALIHDVRWSNVDALRRCFNTMYENYPDKPVVQDEPTGPNGNQPHNAFTRKVYQPTEDHDELLALYTMHVITGQASTYFNDPALVSRGPIDSTWGFSEIPAFWRQMEIPQDIGQGTLKPGHHGDAPLQVTGSGAERADSMVRGGYNIGVISGGSGWRVRAGKRGRATAFTSAGVVWEGDVDRGQVLPISGPTPTIVRIVG